MYEGEPTCLGFEEDEGRRDRAGIEEAEDRNCTKDREYIEKCKYLQRSGRLKKRII